MYFQSVEKPQPGFMPKERVRISPDDRGFVFGDGVYEFIRSYGGRLFATREHLSRLEYSLAQVRIDLVDLSFLKRVAEDLLERNRLLVQDAAVYIQVTRGVSGRSHAFPSPPVLPTVYVAAMSLESQEAEWTEGVSVITVPDTRWHRCDIKSIGLLANVLARQQALEAGAAEAVFVRNGIVTEGTHTSVFGVKQGVVYTHPWGNFVLPGITRQVVLNCCRKSGIPAKESALAESDLLQLEEMFLACTTGEVIPVVRVNHCSIGQGKPGPITRRLQQEFRSWVETCLKQER